MTHTRTLSRLNALAGAKFFDPGYTRGPLKGGPFSIFARLKRFQKLASGGGIGAVWINASINDRSIVRLLVLSFFLSAAQARRSRIFFHGGRWPGLRFVNHAAVKPVVRALLGRFRAIHFLSAVQRDGFLSEFPSIATALYSNFSAHAVPLAKPPRAGAALQLLFVGRMCREKGVGEVVAAHLELRQSGSDVELDFVGDGPLLAEMRQDWELSARRVRIHGTLFGEELSRMYDKADLFIFPTHYPEGFPYVFIEAMRAGVPVLATAEGALADLVRDGQTGFLVAGDAFSLVERITELLAKPERICSMRDACHRFFAEHLSRNSAEVFYRGLLED